MSTTDEEKQRIENLIYRLNGLRAALEAALGMEMADPTEEKMVVMKGDTPSTGEPVKARPFSVLRVLILEALADFPEEPHPDMDDLDSDDVLQLARQRLGVYD